jgi:class 3 adenylate cyclase
MKKRAKYRHTVWLMILSGIVLAVALTVTSLKIIRGGKSFTGVILEENKTFLVNTLRFGHGAMAHMGTGSYESLINLALKSKFIRYLAILDEKGEIVAHSDPPKGLLSQRDYGPEQLEDRVIIKESEDLLFIVYEAEEITMTEEHRKHHATFMGHLPSLPKPGWFLVGLDTSTFEKHYRDMVIQTFGTGIAFLLLGTLIIVFFGVIQRYELAHLSIEKLGKIKRLLGYFVPETAKNMIEKEPEKKGLLDKYIQDATILFLDIEGFSLLLQKYPQERINRTIETYFSAFLDVIQKSGGDINETAGDGMMVIFLHPDPVEHARNAIQAALVIQEQCLRLSENGDPRLFPIQVNIGVHSGEVYLGSTKMRGSEGERWTFTASGGVTIMAARLAQYARDGQILTGDETARRVEELFSLIPLGKVPLKNIEDSAEIYQIYLRKPYGGR